MLSSYNLRMGHLSRHNAIIDGVRAEVKFSALAYLTYVGNQSYARPIVKQDIDIAPYSWAFVQVSSSFISDGMVFFMPSQNSVTRRAIPLSFAVLDLAAAFWAMPI